MDEKRIALAKYRFSKASEELSVSKLAFSSGKFSSSLSSSYYAIFHSVRTLLALEGIDSKKHSGVIHLFSQKFINTKLLETSFSKILVEAFEIRIDSDYKDFYLASKEDAEQQLNNAKYFFKGYC
ncbi:MAG: HEPN domain-containing protein [Bacteroidetes bacterium]|nr:HEPN domain-containing protein [Bacteroidota bacterium]MBU2585087.1 HEPN domain-containing protein [Bacteroidota bacterium]